MILIFKNTSKNKKDKFKIADMTQVYFQSLGKLDIRNSNLQINQGVREGTMGN